jgi:uncharacterized membrane protein (DUF2068 family)
MNRPILIAILSILYGVVGVLTILLGIVAMAGGESITTEFGTGLISGLILVVVGIICLLLAYGFWTGWGPVWYLAIIFGAISVISNIYSIITNGFGVSALLAIIIEGLIIVYMFTNDVRDHFGI